MKTNDTPLRVLVVDDEPLIRSGLYRIFKKSAEVKTVGSAEEALAEIGAHQYDLCFLDYILPGMNGLEAMKIINKRSAHTKVAIMTGSHLEEGTREQIEDIAFEFIEKPFEVSRIREIANRVDATRSGTGSHEHEKETQGSN